MSRPHYHEHAREHAHLIRTGEQELTTSEIGIMSPATTKLGIAVMVILFVAVMGLLIWAIVAFADEKPYTVNNANTQDKPLYVVYQNRAAEPYAGMPQSVLTEVTDVDRCTANCDKDTNCRFFTYDKTNSLCYMYHNSVFPSQFANAAVPGPTQFDASVHVKRGNPVIELRGALRDGNQTIF